MFCRFAIPPDATNYVYWFCVGMLAADAQVAQSTYPRLRRFFEILPLSDGKSVWEAVGERKAKQFLSDVGDVFEALGGICMPDDKESRAFRKLAKSELRWHLTDTAAKIILNQLAALAEKSACCGEGQA